MSSKRAMRQAQKQAYAKHRSNITNSKFELKKKKRKGQILFPSGVSMPFAHNSQPLLLCTFLGSSKFFGTFQNLPSLLHKL